MRDAVAEIIRYNRDFDTESLRRKLSVMTTGSVFNFFRATFHLFAADLSRSPFELPRSSPSGRIVGDLHAENFGTFRSTSNDIVYEINDFDDTTVGSYEVDLRRLLTSLVVGGLEHGLKLSACVAACETAADEYFRVLNQFSKAKRKEDFARLKERAAVKRLIVAAGETPRTVMLSEIVSQKRKSGKFSFKAASKFAPLDERRVRAIRDSFPAFLKNSKAPAGAKTEQYVFEDAVFRFAGKGSLGRERYAVLLRKGLKNREDLSAVRLMEWKESFDSPLDAPAKSTVRQQSKGRAMEVLDATLAMQMSPKRYCGFTTLRGRPFQTKELGANDHRFDPAHYGDVKKLCESAVVFGAVTARAHLLGSLGTDKGPRELGDTATSGTLLRRWIAFALQYAEQTQADFESLRKRKDEVAAAWKIGG